MTLDAFMKFNASAAISIYVLRSSSVVKTVTKNGGNSWKEITHCRRQSHRIEGVPAESGGGALK